MSVPIAYATIIIIWSTTPLAVKWSGEVIHPITAVGLRMALAAAIGLVILRVMGVALRWHKPALKTYGFSQLGIFASMMCVYLAATMIPSGLISVLFALAPIWSNIFAKLLLGESELTMQRLIAFVISFTGLAFICLDDVLLSGNGSLGIALLLASVLLYSVSGVLVQKVEYKAHALSITVGGLICSVPLFALSWWITDGSVPAIDPHEISIWAIVYLAIFGSLLGFCAYFFIIKEVGATSVAMVTLMTPVLALCLGNIANDESISLEIAGGTAMILLGLCLYYQNYLVQITRRLTSQ